MMGSGEQGVSICFTTLQALPSGSRLSTRSPCPSSPQERSGSPLVGEVLGKAPPSPTSCRCRRRFPAEAERGGVTPHAVQNDSEFARHRDACACQAATLGDLHSPGPQARPLAAAHEQRVGSLIERGAGEFVAAATDPALDVGLAGLVACGGQAEMSAHIARPPEAVRPNRSSTGRRAR
jgi:hypothetical protein